MAEQWVVKVKIETLDRGGVKVKNMWDAGQVVSVQIEPHATINMLKQRIALLVSAHTKHQRITNEAGLEFGDITKLADCEGLENNGTVLLHVEQPKVEEKVIEPLSDDEEIWAGAADDDAGEPMPEGEAMNKELTDEQMDLRNRLQGESAELLEDGDKAAALAKLTEAIMVGAPTAMMISKRAELLMKMKKAKASAKDATAALAVNPDSGKAYRVRGRVRRYMGDYSGAKEDLDSAQKIDFDDSVAEMHAYLTKRVAKITALAGLEEKRAQVEADFVERSQPVSRKAHHRLVYSGSLELVCTVQKMGLYFRILRPNQTKKKKAIMVGAPSAMMISKRAELLMKMKKAKAAAKDATAALAVNPDSGKAYRVRGRARRYMGDYGGAKEDLDNAQKIDFDDSVAEMHSYCTKRVAKIMALAGLEEKETK
eukprot:CAMPEP_0183603428 /NCGR_PEP_ID=MMETSP0371-20130417/181442_1 /TAXON_ID=268820 /ORGANISM="Peridinium aciculiferum, Strain PAER-2" /LENGTH=425 /DNA_ID=CAMNT_0025815525 /DNA_START=85 /DNA_END=1363 /DNA_ORIENTATION=+